jgi:hypothetical protein
MQKQVKRLERGYVECVDQGQAIEVGPLAGPKRNWMDLKRGVYAGPTYDVRCVAAVLPLCQTGRGAGGRGQKENQGPGVLCAE